MDEDTRDKLEKLTKGEELIGQQNNLCLEKGKKYPLTFENLVYPCISFCPRPIDLLGNRWTISYLAKKPFKLDDKSGCGARIV